MFSEDYEEFSESQIKTLEKYVTNTKGHIFVLRNLPEVIKGALFSRYSRSSMGLRSLLLKEFISNNDESAFLSIAGGSSLNEEESVDQMQAVKKAQSFYDRILDGYGDDSIGELGGAHIALENISMLAAKAVEDCRIGGSPLEKSTRYIYFDQKVKGEYLFYKEPILMTSAYRELYENTCNMLFETYSKQIPLLTGLIEANMPRDPNISKTAFSQALRAKVLDCLRGLLPCSTLTNMGLFGNGRFYEQLLHKLHCSKLLEQEEIGKRMQEELAKVIPSFVRRADVTHHTHKAYAEFIQALKSDLKMTAHSFNKEEGEKEVYEGAKEAFVRLSHFDPDAPYHVAAALLFPETNASFDDLLEKVKALPEEDLNRILEAGCSSRENRRQKSPRALEHAAFTYEIVADFGAYRDLQRHRILTQDRQLLNCDLGYFVPKEIKGTFLEEEYVEALEKAKKAFDLVAKEFPEEAQYVIPMAYNIRWYYNINLRGLQWLTELRSSPAGHTTYRFVAQELAKQTFSHFPMFERFFKFVDFEGYEMGRMGQEIRKEEKASRYLAI